MKETKDIFVIMPFKRTSTRKKQDLTAFFEDNLKTPIENCQDFEVSYRVRRSDDSFDIGKQIVRDIYNADIVLCDLSGEHANPNVMYELGLRLALTNKPVIMFREDHPDNKPIFDISVYHTKEYSVTRYKELETYIIGKILKFEKAEEVFHSPVLDILSKEPSVVEEIEIQRAKSNLEAIYTGLTGVLRGTGGAIHRFLLDQESELTLPRNIDKNLRFLQENKDELASLNWSELNFHPSFHPSLHTYISQLPLNGVVEEWISKLWNTAISEYFDRFYSTDLYWSFIDYHSLHSFVGETSVLRSAVPDLIMYLNKVSKQDKDKELNDMLDSFSQYMDFSQELIEGLRQKI